MTTHLRASILRSMFAATALLVLMVAPATGESGAFQSVKAKTFSKQKFTFPSGLKGARLNVLFLAMSDGQKNGQYQQEALLDWQAALDARDVFNNDVVAYHFPVLQSPPFFVKGIIASAMRDSYEGKVPLDQAAVLYVDDLVAFASTAELTLDQRPTIVIAAADGRPLHSVKGEVTPEGIAAVIAAIRDHLPAVADP